LDFKSTRAKFNEITQSDLYTEFDKTLNYLIKSKFPFEVRTTVHSELLDENDIQLMAQKLEASGYRGKYFLQNYVNNAVTIGNVNNSKKNYLNIENIETFLEIIIRN
jgi:pyruvate formate lyase activating enzyme